MHKHFNEKDAASHVLEKRMEGLKEVHGTELPGHFSSATDTLRETAFVLLIISLFVSKLSYIFIIGIGWMLWRMGRSAYLGWSRLERLHKLIEQEKFEIEHHRPQEREELIALYRGKGFHGKLLEEVVDVLMADEDRLLKVMLEEELGLTLEAYEHPLKQAAGAFVGALIALIIFSLGFAINYLVGGLISSLLTIGFGAFLTAKYERNKVISSVVWNISFAILGAGFIFFLIRIING